ncbi:hypothetical protein [Ruegeria jejuensis]|uniref:hypothetical protein n=1 Tax=Ruegeria jejuensis TaxID=3233338 RepID=UPI00355ADABE
MNRLLTGLACLWAFSGPAAAQVQVPQDCTALATVHKNSCAVSTVMDCGQTFLVFGFLDGNPESANVYDRNWGMLEFLYRANAETRFTLKPGSGKNLQLDQLLSDGVATESGVFLFNTRVVKNREFTFDGKYTLDEEEVVLDGHTFRKGVFLREMEREGIEGSKIGFGFDFLGSDELDLFIEGSLTRHFEGRDSLTVDQTPRAIRFPGQPGFLATRSEFGCDG